MAIKDLYGSLPGLFKKYKIPLIILAVGIVLLIVPGAFESSTNGKEYNQLPEEAQQDMCCEIEEILSKVSGVGNVRVMLSVAAGETNIYQIDEKITENSDFLQASQR